MPERKQSRFMERSPEWFCTECGHRFSWEDRDCRLIKEHSVVGFYDHYDYEELDCCPRCGSPRIEEIEEDE